MNDLPINSGGHRILLIDNNLGYMINSFDHYIRPHIPQEVIVDAVKDAKSAIESLQGNFYAIAVIEEVLNPTELKTGPISKEDRELGEKLLAGEIKGPIKITIPGLTGRSVNEIIQPAHRFLEQFIQASPKTRFIITCHSKGGGPGKERIIYESFPEVIGVFAWIRTEANRKKIIEIILDTLENE